MQVLQGGSIVKPVRVLVADDDPVMRSLLRANLEDFVADVVEASDGEEAWALLSKQVFELALIDLSMPGLDGFNLIQCIRSHPRTRHLPIVVITASADQTSLRMALDAGATSFLTKPVHWALFSHQIDYLLRLDRSNAVERATKQRAEAVVRAKDALIAALAARVRDQARLLVEQSETAMMRGSIRNGESLDFVQSVLANARGIESTLDEMLPHFRSMTEQIVVDDRPVGVRRLVDPCVEELAELACLADVEIEVAPIASGLRVCCDERAMRRALSNLLRNAVEFTRPGSVVRIGADVQTDGALVIWIDDDGPGVDPEIIARCLKPLDAEDGNVGHEVGALGLPIARAIASAHGGTVEVVPGPNSGTRACLFLPAEIVEQRLEDVA
jgi:two-component system sensor histidine kinase/response regulator